jgi:hypothetical protein
MLMKKEKKWIFIVLSFSFFFWSAYNSANNDQKEKEKTVFFKRFSVATLKNPPKNIFNIKQNISLIKKDNIEELVRAFVRSGLPNRMVGTPGHLGARQFILDTILKIDPNKSGLTYVDSFEPKVEVAKKAFLEDFKESVEKHYEAGSEIYKLGKSFTDSRVSYLKANEKTTGKNIIWEKKGAIRPDEVYVITAHYDGLALKEDKSIHATARAPGADDNASGVALAFSMIKLFSVLDIPATVRVVFMDWEEFGGLGSLAFKEKYTSEFKNKKLVGIINLEALGHDSKTGDKESRYGNMRAYISKPDEPYYAKEKLFAEKLLEKGKKAHSAPRFKLVSNSEPLEGSPGFWEDSWPSVSFSQNWQDDSNFKRVHTSDDFPETLNFRTLFDSYRFITGALLSMLYLP